MPFKLILFQNFGHQVTFRNLMVPSLKKSDRSERHHGLQNDSALTNRLCEAHCGSSGCLHLGSPASDVSMVSDVDCGWS